MLLSSVHIDLSAKEDAPSASLTKTESDLTTELLKDFEANNQNKEKKLELKKEHKRQSPVKEIIKNKHDNKEEFRPQLLTKNKESANSGTQGAIKPEKTIKAGVMESTPLMVVAEWSINSDTQTGEHFSARVVDDFVTATGEVLIPHNSRVIGTIVNVEGARTFHQDAEVTVKFEKIIFPDNIHGIDIQADGSLRESISNNKSTSEKIASGAKAVIEGTLETGLSAFTGATLAYKFGGLLGISASGGDIAAVGAAVGASYAIVKLIAKRGEDLELYPGTPMTLNMISMQDQKIKEEKMQATQTGVSVNVLKRKGNKLAITIHNDLDESIPLTNLKIIDGLGYTVKPEQGFRFFDNKKIPANSEFSYEFNFPTREFKSREWLVLTDSFGKQEYFRVEI